MLRTTITVREIRGVRPNGLPISRAAEMYRDGNVADSGAQNRHDLARRERRRLDGRVGRHRV